MRIGIDVGGTKIEGVALTEDGRERFRARVATPRGDYAGTIAAIVALVRRIEAETAQTGTVGIGIPGTLSRVTGLVKNANSVWMIGRPLQHDLEAALSRPVRLANDANCFALSEATDGAGAGAEVVFGVIVGTGTGGGIVVRGQLLTGPHGIAGEWGHNPLPWPEADELPGAACYCGRSGCIETFLSGPGLARDHEARTGAREAAEGIAARAGAGDPAAEASLVRYERRMARALATIINVIDPDVIVLGGGMSNVERLYGTVPTLWAPYVFACGTNPSSPGDAGSAVQPEPIRTRLVRAAHGDASGVRGAAWLWPAQSGSDPGSDPDLTPGRTRI